MSVFDKAIQMILSFEGGYVNHPNDPGGETNFGISKRAYPKLDIANLTKEQAIEIYRKDYWEKLCCDSLPTPLNVVLLDFAINSGRKRALEFLNDLISPSNPLKPSDIAKAIPESNILNLDFKLLKARANFLIDLAISPGSKYAVFLKGWMNRIATLNLFVINNRR